MTAHTDYINYVLAHSWDECDALEFESQALSIGTEFCPRARLQCATVGRAGPNTGRG